MKPDRMLETFIVLVLLASSLPEILACRYNVRETGFVDLGLDRFQLVCYVDSRTPLEEMKQIEESSAELITDSCFSFQIVSVDEQPDHPALEFWRSFEGHPRPSAALISPTGRALWLGPLWDTEFSSDSLRTAFSKVLSSPLREKIAEELVTAFAVVLMIEGEDQGENDLAATQILQAIATLESELEYFPKPIKKGPVVVTVNQEELISDRLLLWTLQLEKEALSRPIAVVLYGKGRWIGPMMTGEEIKRDLLSRILFLVGADCECDLDPILLRGTRMPIPWNRDLQSIVSRDLGFDPDNPLVRMEVSQILRVHNWYARVAENRDNQPELPDPEEHTETTPTGGLFSRFFYIISGVIILVLAVGTLKLIRFARHS